MFLGQKVVPRIAIRPLPNVKILAILVKTTRRKEKSVEKVDVNGTIINASQIKYSQRSEYDPEFLMMIVHTIMHCSTIRNRI